jgi:hypothetical protein
VGRDLLPEPSIPDLAMAILLGEQHVEQLPAARDQFAQRLRLGGRQRPDRGLHAFRKARDGFSIERVRLGELAGSPGEVADLPGIGHDDGQAGARQPGRHRRFVAARGLQHDEAGR